MSKSAAYLVCFTLLASGAFARDVIFEDGFEMPATERWTHTEGGDFTVMLPGDVPLVLVPIPAGGFMMGSPIDERGRWDQEDLHAVTLTTSYSVGKFEVTQAQWVAVMGTTPWMDATCELHGEGANYPAYCVSWDQIAGDGGFLETLNNYLSATSQPSNFRLPTEAEWERAVRAGTQSEFSFDTSTNPDWDTLCGDFPEAESCMWWCGGNSPRPVITMEVCTKSANPYGLCDMHGNVWEWVADRFSTHLGHDGQVDPPGPSTGDSRTRRGGSYQGDARSCRSASRLPQKPWTRYHFIGFRVARTE